jgi:NitT/TauT family transport system substrate-binding protein
MKPSRVAFILAALLLLLGACSTSQGVSAQPPLRVAWNLWPGCYPLILAQERGLFEKHGLQVEPVRFDQLTEMPAATLSRKVDAAILPWADALTMDAHSPGQVRVVLVADNSDGADQIVANATVTSIADLKGQRIGTALGSIGELLISTMLKNNGLSLGDVSLINISPETLPDQLGTTLVAGHTYEPYTSAAIQKGHHIIFSSADTPGLIPDVMVVQSQIARQRPEDLRAFMAAWFEALDYWQTNPAQANAIIAQAIGLKPDEVSSEGVRMFSREENLRAFAPSTDPTSLYVSGQIYSDFLITTGRSTSRPDVERLLDSSFVKQPQ